MYVFERYVYVSVHVWNSFKKQVKCFKFTIKIVNFKQTDLVDGYFLGVSKIYKFKRT